MGFFKSISKAFEKPAAMLSGVASGIPVVGSFLGPALGAYAEQQATEDRNTEARNVMREQNSFSAQMAQKQMDFEERMSSTAWQRGTEDMKKAGINPIFAYSAGGASTPSASAPQGAGYNPETSPAGRYLASAMEVKNFKANLELLQKQRNVVQADAYKKAADANLADTQRQGEQLENELKQKRNDFYDKNPWMFKLNTSSPTINSAVSALRLLK